jgi:dTDP-4-dehydrorhamnose reductase
LSGQRVPDARPTILLIGKDGQLGRELAAVLPAHGEVVACGRATLDLADPAAIVKAVGGSASKTLSPADAYP